MTVASIQTLVRDLTNTDSTTFTDADILRLLNIKYGHRILDIVRAETDKNATINEAKTNLISITGLSEGDLGYNGEYPFPTDLLKPVRIELTYSTEPFKATIYDINENLNSEYDQSQISSGFSTNNPFVRFDRNSYFVRPLPTTSITNGIHIWYEKRQADLTTDSPTFESNLHDILAYDVAQIKFIKNADNYSETQYRRFNEDKDRVEARFFEFYKNRMKRTFTLTSKINSYR